MSDTVETSITEINIGPDGRIFVCGLSSQVLSILTELCPHDFVLQRRAARAGSSTSSSDSEPPIHAACEVPAADSTMVSMRRGS